MSRQVFGEELANFLVGRHARGGVAPHVHRLAAAYHVFANLDGAQLVEAVIRVWINFDVDGLAPPLLRSASFWQ
jgi:hypothetical protein